MSAIEKYQQFMSKVDWEELSAGAKEALYEATRGVSNPNGQPFQVITEGGKDSAVTIIYDSGENEKPQIDLTHDELVDFHRWLEDIYMDGDAALYITKEREKEKEQKLSIENNLTRLYRDTLNLAKNSSSDIEVKITPIGGTQPIVCFFIDINKESSILVFTKEILNIAMGLLSTVYKGTSFKYYIQQISNDKYSIVSQADFLSIKDKKISELNNYQARQYSYLELLELLKLEFQSLNEKVKSVLKSVAQAYEKENKAISLFLKGISNKIGIKKEYKYTKASKRFSFIREDEDKFYRLFFKKGSHVKQICRYCGFESLFQILSNQTIRMNGLVGMNDKSEYKYAYNSFASASYKKVEAKMEEQMDKAYIMSCSPSTSKDDLEMWRLYGDDGKGVCMIFNVEEKYQPFILAQILYEYTRNGKKKINEPKWNLLKQLTERLKEIDLPLEFLSPNKWFSLMKSGDYCYEQEIRLLYIEEKVDHESKHWVLTKTNSILNPYVQFDLVPKKKGKGSSVAIPLKLKGIILGPKCPEKEANVAQLRNMLNRDPELKKLDIDVAESEITNYR